VRGVHGSREGNVQIVHEKSGEAARKRARGGFTAFSHRLRAC
jgi:hypothetical protein